MAAKKKKGGEKYLTIEGPDFVWTAEIKRDKKDIDKAMKFINQVNTNSKIYSKSMQINSSTTSIADELKKFKELLDSGIALNPMKMLNSVQAYIADANESPDAFYNRTIHTGNIGVLTLDVIENYTSVMLALPKPKLS